MNVHWMVLYKLYVFCSGMKFKMAATAGLRMQGIVASICPPPFFISRAVW
jgi:hypothetical protein